MLNSKSVCSMISLLALSLAGNAMAEHSEEHKMTETYGCKSCHALAPGAVSKNKKIALPIGPSFQEIAARYHANKDEGKYQELYRIIKHGSSPYRSKWQGKISGLAMPPNDDTIPDLDINRMLVWILTANHSGQ